MMVMPVLVVLHFRFLKVHIDPCNSSLTGCPLGMNLLESTVRRTTSGILDLSSCGMCHKMKRHADFGTHLFQTNRTWNSTRPISPIPQASPFQITRLSRFFFCSSSVLSAHFSLKPLLGLAAKQPPGAPLPQNQFTWR